MGNSQSSGCSFWVMMFILAILIAAILGVISPFDYPIV